MAYGPWSPPDLVLLPPVAAVLLAERTGSIGPMTYSLVDVAVRQMRDWLDAGLDLRVSVNLAGPNIADSALPERTAAILARWDVPADRLCFEISERAVMERPERVT